MKKFLSLHYVNKLKDIVLPIDSNTKIILAISQYSNSLTISSVANNKTALETMFREYVNVDDLSSIEYIINDKVFQTIDVLNGLKIYKVEDVDFGIQEIVEINKPIEIKG